MTAEQSTTIAPTTFVLEASSDEKTPTKRYVAIYDIPHAGHVITKIVAERPFTQGFMVLSGVKTEISRGDTQEVWAGAPLFRNYFSNCSVVLHFETAAEDPPAKIEDYTVRLVSDLWPEAYASEFYKEHASFIFVYNPSISAVLAYPRDGKSSPKRFLPGCFPGTDIFQVGKDSGLLRWWENPVISLVPPAGAV